MKPEAMILHGKSLLDYYNGDRTAEITLRRDDGFETVIPIRVFFRSETEFFPGELEAINLCRGIVLDIGAGSGIHSLVLQSRGMKVTAVDIDPNAVNIMIDREIKNVRCVDVMKFESGPFDTLLMLGHGIGMVEDIQGFYNFLDHASSLIGDNGQLLLNSVDVRQTGDQIHLKYHQSNRNAGRYIGEVRMQFEYKGEKGPFFGWLHIDPQTLQKLAAMRYWNSEIIFQGENGEYLARLTYKKSV
jgi:SAM-dependent methyltransferase